ncbi:MAG: transporter substrate-binding domain-containing protein, partial [Opitutaceae bacterium]|nr:transporter substrate-binding domain-containing protein [Opitutaceae bacterium]
MVFLLLVGSGAGLVGEAKPLRIGVENNSPPLSSVDAAGRPVGFSADLLKEMARVRPIEIEIVPNYWGHVLSEFMAGRLDALANVTITEERRKSMDFSISHAYVHGLIYFRADRPPLRRTADFAGKIIATLSGSIGYTNALTHGGWGATIRAYDSWQDALDATFRGECDGALFIRSPGSSPDSDEHGLHTEFVEDIVHEFHFAVHKGDSESLEKINEALAVVRHNGAFDRIYAKWIGPLEPHPIRLADLRPYYLPVSLGLAALIALFWWQRHMLARSARQAAALRASEERWKFALEGSGDGAWDWDKRTNTVLRTRRWKEMLGYTEDEIGTGLNEWMDHIHPEDRAKAIAAQEAHYAGQTPAFAVEHRLRCKDGSWKWILNRGMIVDRDAQGRPQRIIGTHSDLTASKEAEADRLVLGKLESTGVLAGGIAHDFNNLLTAILLNLELARMNGNSTTELLRRVEAAEKAAQAARSLTQQLITFAQGGVSVVRVTNLTPLLR